MAMALRATKLTMMATTTTMATGDKNDNGDSATEQQDTTTTTMATGDNDDGDGATGDEVFNEQTNE
jgi:hypothetical protein